MTPLPRKLSIARMSPHYNLEAAKAVDKVFCDGVLVPFCVFYDRDTGKARGKTAVDGNWLPIVQGTITVTVKEGQPWSKPE
jgi:hypothetical protein